MIKLEQETTITFNVEEDEAIICTFWAKLQKRLQKMGFQPYQKTENGQWFKIPKKLITIRKARTKRDLSDEQREAIGRRFKNGRLRKNQEP